MISSSRVLFSIEFTYPFTTCWFIRTSPLLGIQTMISSCAYESESCPASHLTLLPGKSFPRSTSVRHEDTIIRSLKFRARQSYRKTIQWIVKVTQVLFVWKFVTHVCKWPVLQAIYRFGRKWPSNRRPVYSLCCNGSRRSSQYYTGFSFCVIGLRSVHWRQGLHVRSRRVRSHRLVLEAGLGGDQGFARSLFHRDRVPGYGHIEVAVLCKFVRPLQDSTGRYTYTGKSRACWCNLGNSRHCSHDIRLHRRNGSDFY